MGLLFPNLTSPGACGALFPPVLCLRRQPPESDAPPGFLSAHWLHLGKPHPIVIGPRRGLWAAGWVGTPSLFGLPTAE